MNIQINRAGTWQEVSKEEFLELVSKGVIRPNTEVIVNDTKAIAARLKELVFSSSVAVPSSAQYATGQPSSSDRTAAELAATVRRLTAELADACERLAAISAPPVVKRSRVAASLMLRDQRIKLDMSMFEMSRRTGISEFCLYGYEGGKSFPRAKRLTRIINGYELDREQAAVARSAVGIRDRKPEKRRKPKQPVPSENDPPTEGVADTVGIAKTPTPSESDPPTPSPPQLGSRVAAGIMLREQRVKLGMSFVAMSERVGISASNLSGYEAGRSFPRLAKLHRVVDGYGLGYDEIALLWSVCGQRDHKPKKRKGRKPKTPAQT